MKQTFKSIPTQNEIAKKIMKEPVEIVRKAYYEKSIPAQEVQKKYIKTEGYSEHLFEIVRNWFNTSVVPESKNIKYGLNYLGYQRLIVTALKIWE